MNTSHHKVLSVGLLLSPMAAYGCDSADDELAEHGKSEGTEPNDQNIVLVEEQFTEDPGLARELDLAAAPEAPLGPAGKCCYAECYDGVNAWYQLWWISADCNAKAAAWCSSHNWGLKDAEWYWC
jgi:hypothetical protein